MSTETESNKEVYITSQATCALYKATFEDYNMPGLSTNFQAGVASLGTDINAYYTFIDNFGTHYVETVKMGAKYGYINQMTQVAYSKLTSQGIDVSAAASYASVAKVGVKTSYDTSSATAFTSATTSTTQYSIGSTIPTNAGDQTAWAQQVITDPMPISYSLKSMDVLLA